MRNTSPKALIAGVTALSLTASVFGATEAAAAAGGGGWHGGGWHGGGWHGGGWNGGGWHGGHGHWHGGAGWWGPAIVGGLAAGALLAAPYYYGSPGGCYAYAPTYDAYGNYIGQQLVYAC